MQHDLTRNTLAAILVVGLIALCFWVLRPFLAASVWATMIVVATWPWLKGLERAFGNRRAPAVFVMTLGMLLLLVLPLWWAISTIAERSHDLMSFGQGLVSKGVPAPPDWVKSIPLIGEKISDFWLKLSSGGFNSFVEYLTPYASSTGKWLLSQFGGIGGMLLQFFLVVLIAAIFYSSGEEAAKMVRRLGRRLAGDRGEGSIVLAGQAIRAVALGVGVTAVLQTSLGGLGLVIAGVPFAAVLSALMLMLCIAQAGPSLVMFPAVAWMYWQGDNSWATFLLVWSIVVSTMDNFVRPMLIKRGADLPLLLIFVGVIGGLLSFGLIGIFVGPVALAVTYTLAQAWVSEIPEDQSS
ncbi:AI-2E family transporter YdiK [Zwartia vadi]|uniref:AI-2E family transporter YdiK n=1 Tax=Zwartia vadi TaxID=3058168 RepID=UPI0025B2CDE2|nr:AI-2E family transporter YdiK [Zwartia vadi]MDN3988784.1 AI-2E family transporter YdiK [Zwartia vadi]